MRVRHDRSLPALTRIILAALLALLVAAASISTTAQVAPNATAGVRPFAQQRAEMALPQDAGIAGLRQMIRKLRTTARLLHTTAHPDDEDGAMLTLE